MRLRQSSTLPYSGCLSPPIHKLGLTVVNRVKTYGLTILVAFLFLALSAGCGSQKNQVPETSPTPGPSAQSSGTRTLSKLPKPTGFGYGMQIDSGNDYQRAFKLLKDAGFNWAKIQVRWEDLEPAPGRIQWDHWDKVVNQAQANGVYLLFSVVTAPQWARPGSDHSIPGPPMEASEYAKFVGTLASRYNGRVHAY
ncbi:MAG: hypothetical protein HW403_116 [Dehalococcoidia bacterium]|nr:hypothetical protein [Dehalococcoidia bacterium]